MSRNRKWDSDSEIAAGYHRVSLEELEASEQLLENDLYELCQGQSVHFKLLPQLKEDARLVRQLF